MTSMIDLQVTELVGKSKYLYLITKCHLMQIQMPKAQQCIYCIMYL